MAFSSHKGLEVINLEYSLNLKINPNDWLQPINALYFEFENDARFITSRPDCLKQTHIRQYF